MTHSRQHSDERLWAPWAPDRRQMATLEGPEGRLYDLLIATPQTLAPMQGWPCLFVLDGERFFDAFAGTADALALRPEKTGVQPIVIAALASRSGPEGRRGRDFTSSADPERGPAAPHGGGDLFRRFLMDDVRRAVAEACAIDVEKLGLFGHSLAGLFVLETLETQPDAFARWISISPSLWWRRPDPAIARDSLFVGWGEGEKGRAMSTLIPTWLDDAGQERRTVAVMAPGADHGSTPFALLPDILRHASR